MVRLVTGGTGFIGRHLLRELAKRDGDTYVLVREPSRARLERLIASLGAADRMRALAGALQPGLVRRREPKPRSRDVAGQAAGRRYLSPRGRLRPRGVRGSQRAGERRRN